MWELKRSLSNSLKRVYLWKVIWKFNLVEWKFWEQVQLIDSFSFFRKVSKQKIHGVVSGRTNFLPNSFSMEILFWGGFPAIYDSSNPPQTHSRPLKSTDPAGATRIHYLVWITNNTNKTLKNFTQSSGLWFRLEEFYF